MIGRVVQIERSGVILPSQSAEREIHSLPILCTSVRPTKPSRQVWQIIEAVLIQMVQLRFT
jgi:hypothetical protein